MSAWAKDANTYQPQQRLNKNNPDEINPHYSSQDNSTVRHESKVLSVFARRDNLGY